MELSDEGLILSVHFSGNEESLSSMSSSRDVLLFIKCHIEIVGLDTSLHHRFLPSKCKA